MSTLNVRARRVALGMTRQQLANHAGCSMSYLAVIESGATIPHSEVVPRVVAVLEAAESKRGRHE